MSLPETNFSKLTTITGVEQKGKGPSFTINCPVGFKEAVRQYDDWPLSFSFTGDQGIPFIFTTSGGTFADEKTLIIGFPDTIRENQRRQYVRIKLGSEARLKARISDRQYTMSLVDVSEGGALVMVEEKKAAGRPLLSKNQPLTNLQLERLSKKQAHDPITVDAAVVRRVAVGATSGNYHYGIMFTDIKKDEAQRLKNALNVDRPQKPRKNSFRVKEEPSTQKI